MPGAVSAWVDLSKRFGTLAFADLLAPAIGYARDGFLVTPTIAALWESGGKQLMTQPGFAEAFLPGGKAPATGKLFRNLPLAQSLELIADSQGESFYRGELAEKMPPLPHCMERRSPRTT